MNALQKDENELRMYKALALSEEFTAREMGIITHCLAYAEDAVGLPAHNLMVIVAKLVRMMAGDLNSEALDRIVSESRRYMEEVEKLNAAQKAAV
jgi:hypothetical protein